MDRNQLINKLLSDLIEAYENTLLYINSSCERMSFNDKDDDDSRNVIDDFNDSYGDQMSFDQFEENVKQLKSLFDNNSNINDMMILINKLHDVDINEIIIASYHIDNDYIGYAGYRQCQIDYTTELLNDLLKSESNEPKSEDKLSIDVIFVDTENNAIKLWHDWEHYSDDIFNAVIERLKEINITYDIVDYYDVYVIHNKDNNIQSLIDELEELGDDE